MPSTIPIPLNFILCIAMFALFTLVCVYVSVRGYARHETRFRGLQYVFRAYFLLVLLHVFSGCNYFTQGAFFIVPIFGALYA